MIPSPNTLRDVIAGLILWRWMLDPTKWKVKCYRCHFSLWRLGSWEQTSENWVEIFMARLQASLSPASLTNAAISMWIAAWNPSAKLRQIEYGKWKTWLLGGFLSCCPMWVIFVLWVERCLCGVRIRGGLFAVVHKCVYSNPAIFGFMGWFYVIVMQLYFSRVKYKRKEFTSVSFQLMLSV